MPLRRVLNSLTHLGVGPETEPRIARYVILTNSIALVGLLVSLFYIAINPFLMPTGILQFGPSIFGAATFALPLWLNHQRRYWAATTAMCLTSFALQLLFVWLFGYHAGNQFYLLPLLGGVPLIYAPLHRKTAALLVVVGLFTFFALALWGDRIAPLAELDPATAHAYYTLALVTSAVLIALVSFFAYRRAVIAEGQADARTRDLARALHELKEAQAQMIETENQAVLGRLAAGLLHEVNTPLGAIRSAAGTIGGAVSRSRDFVVKTVEPEHPDGQSALRSMEVSTELCKSLEVSTDRIRTVVESLGEFVALDEAERKLFDVRRGLDRTLELLGVSLGNRIDVVREYSETLPRIYCAPARLNQTFLCILQNSIQAIEGKDGKGEIRIRVREDQEGVVVEVVDNGKGIPSHVLPEVFQLGLTKKRGRVGLRLGLALSKRTVEEMGGRLALESVEGRGTTVRMVLPSGP